MSLILAPFSMLLNYLNSIFDSYGIAIMIFAVFVKFLLFPFSIKGKRGMIAMTSLQGEMGRLKKQYGKDPQRYNQEVQELYLREQVNPMSGCLWTLLPLFILLPLYTIIREPVEYILGLSETQLYELATLVNWDAIALETGILTQDLLDKAYETNLKNDIISGFHNSGYNQLYLASLVPETGLTLADGTVIQQMNFHLMGIDLTRIPNWKIWQDLSLQNIGTLLLVAVSAVSGFLFSQLSQKTNRINNPNQEISAQQAQTNKTMMYTMPIMSIWIGLIMPSIMVVYWISNNLLAMVQETVASQILKKDYEAMRIKQEQQAIAAKEEEKRLKAEKVAEIQRRKDELGKNKGKKGKKKPSPDKVEKTEKAENKSNDESREGLRSYARGRAYQADRYPNPHLMGENGENPSDSALFTTAEPVKQLEATQIPQDEGYDEVKQKSEAQGKTKTEEEIQIETQELEQFHLSHATEEEKEEWETQKRRLKEDIEES